MNDIQTQQMIDTMIDQKVMSGVVYAFYQDGEAEVFVKGKRQTTPTVAPMTRESIFDIASLTKVVGTTTVIFQLVEEGYLSLDDPVNQFLPITSNTLKVGHLLTHTSDFQGYIEHREALEARDLAYALMNEMIPGEKMGEKVTYSDINFIYLGWIIEHILNQPVHQAIQERVLQPLEMTHTSMYPKGEVVPTECHATRGLICGQVHDPKTYRLQEHSGSAGLFSTIDDLLKFVQMYLNEGKAPNGQVIIPKSRIDTLTQNYVQSANRPYSLGWNLERKSNHWVLTHTGYTGTYLLIDPIEKTAFIFLSNRIHPVDDKERYIRYRDQLIQTYITESEGVK